MSNIARIGPGVNVRKGNSTTFDVVKLTDRLEYALVFGVVNGLDPDGNGPSSR